MALLGVLPGILLAIALSILNVFRRVWWPHQAELGRVDGIAGLHDTERYPSAELLPGLVVYRFDAPLIFANSRTFGDAVARAGRGRPRRALGASSPPNRSPTSTRPRRTCCRSWTTGSTSAGVSLVFAEIKDPVREKIERYELTRTIDRSPLLPDARRSGRRLRGGDGAELALDPRRVSMT